MNNMSFREELKHVINKHNMENGSDTPDYILARFLIETLDAFDSAVERRDRHHGNPSMNQRRLQAAK